MLPGKKYKPEDMLWVVWRRKWAVIIPFVLILAGTVAVVRTLPNRYLSETVILIVQQRVPESYVRATVTTRIEDRMRSIQQQILSRTRLEAIVRDLDLYPAERQQLPMQDVVERMRRDVVVTVVQGDAFRIAFTYKNPKAAMLVVERLASELINENLQDREVLATATTDFLQSQLEDARRRLAEQESKVAEFQRRHAGELPSERDANLQVLHNLQLQVQALLDSANRDRDRRLLLERTLADLEATVPAAPLPAVTRAGSDCRYGAAPLTTAERLDAARETLKALELRLTPGHPDVVYIKRQITGLEAKLKAEAAQPSSPAPRTVRARTPEEANQLRRIQETRQELNGVIIALASKQGEEKQLRDRIAAVEKKVSATPKLEAELTALTRDYDTVRRGYESLLAKQEDSKVAAALEQRQIGEYFKVLDRARLPEGPASPNRQMLNLVGALAGLGVGLGLVALLEYKDMGLRSEEDVISVLRLPVLAAIPVIETTEDRRRARRRRVFGLVGAAVVVVALAGAALLGWTNGLIRLPALLR